MQTTTAETHESNDLEDRDVRALTEYMTVLPLGGDVYSVTTQSGSEYRVDAREGRCTCPDHQYREVRCKHIRRVVFATGERPVPAWVDADEVDAQLGQHVDGTPKVAVTDGGVTFEEFVIPVVNECVNRRTIGFVPRFIGDDYPSLTLAFVSKYGN